MQSLTIPCRARLNCFRLLPSLRDIAFEQRCEGNNKLKLMEGLSALLTQRNSDYTPITERFGKPYGAPSCQNMCRLHKRRYVRQSETPDLKLQ